MKKLVTALTIFVLSNFSQAQSLELKLLNLNVKSRDLINLGIYETQSFTPEIEFKMDVLKIKNPRQSVYLGAGAHQLNLNSKNVLFSNLFLGYKINLERRLLLESSLGLRDFYYFSTENNGTILLQKKSRAYLKFHGHLALMNLLNVTMIGDGFMLYCANQEGFKCNEIGVGLSGSFNKDKQNHRIGYRLEYQQSYDSVESNSIFRHNLYYKINF